VVQSVAIVILAAGASSRMRGGDKLLEQVAGEALLRRQAGAALSTGARVIVALSDKHPKRAEALAGLAVETVSVADPSQGMSRSIHAAVAVLRFEDAVMILPADMPELDRADLAKMIAKARENSDCILRGASEDGHPGHPVIFPRRLFTALSRIEGDAGARAVVARETPVLVPLPGTHAITDLDTPEDWANWRAQKR